MRMREGTTEVFGLSCFEGLEATRVDFQRAKPVFSHEAAAFPQL
jgi:hypothetical protein